MADDKMIGVNDGKKEQLQKLQEKMKRPLLAKLEWLLEWMADDRRNTLIKRWELGNEMAELEEGDQKFGAKPIEKLDKFVEDSGMLRVVIRLAQCWTRPEIEAMSDRMMANGVGRVGYTHLRTLCVIADKKQRDDLLEETIRNSWTAQQLGAVIVSRFGNKSQNPTGRAGIPKTAQKVIQQQLDFADDFSNRNVRVWKDPEHSLSRQIAAMPEPDYTEDLAKQLGILAKRMRDLAAEATSRAEEAEREHKKVTDAIAASLKPVKMASELMNKEEQRPAKGRKGPLHAAGLPVA